jgi:hypothetical protein
MAILRKARNESISSMGTLFFTLISLSLGACSQSRYTRSPYESLITTIRDPLSRKCAALDNASNYCGNVRGDALERNSNQNECQLFYQAALDAAHIQCSYDDQLKELHRSGALSRTDYMADRLKQIHTKFHQRASQLLDVLDEAYRESKNWTDEQELTYRNIKGSLNTFLSRVHLEKPSSTRRPASSLNEKIPDRFPTESTAEQMRNLIIPITKTKKGQ